MAKAQGDLRESDIGFSHGVGSGSGYAGVGAADYHDRSVPVIMVDAHYDKVRVEDRDMTLPLMIAHGVKSDGIREILALEPMFDEPEDS